MSDGSFYRTLVGLTLGATLGVVVSAFGLAARVEECRAKFATGECLIEFDEFKRVQLTAIEVVRK